MQNNSNDPNVRKRVLIFLGKSDRVGIKLTCSKNTKHILPFCYLSQDSSSLTVESK